MNYTFHSTDPDNYNEVFCPIFYSGVCKRVKWWVSEITSIHNIIVLNPDDYIKFEIENDLGVREEVIWHPEKRYTDITSNFDCDFNDDDTVDIQIYRTELNTFKFESTHWFKIWDMSYNCKQVFGLYYLDKVEIEAPATEYDDLNNPVYFVIESKAVGYGNSTSVWFLISNLGQPNQITTHNNKWTPIFPSVVMNIQNTFQDRCSISYNNADYQTTSPTSALSNLRVKLVDGNLEPLHLLNPLYVTVYVQEIPDEETSPIEEQMAYIEKSAEIDALIKNTMSKLHEKKATSSASVEKGVSEEPPPPDFPEQKETSPQEIKLEQDTMNELEQVSSE